MRSLLSIFYSNQRLASCSATVGINKEIRTTIFSKLIKIKYLQRFSKCTTSLFCSEYCEEKFPHVTADKLKRDLTCKCGEERRKMKKGGR